MMSLYDLFEPGRWLLGSRAPIFLLEVVLRIIFLYAVLVGSMRAMGRRMSSQLTRNELLALVALAGAIGPAVQDPKRGLLPPLVCALLIVLVQRLHARLTLRSERLERFFDGEPSLLVIDGRLCLDRLRSNAISRERLFAQLRGEGLLHLGQVRRVYLEPSGAFCILQRSEAQAGLSLVPDWDPALLALQSFDHARQACRACGNVVPQQASVGRCSHCGDDDWTAPAEANRPLRGGSDEHSGSVVGWRAS